MRQPANQARAARHPCAGFMLIELTMAFSILTVGLFGVVAMYNFGTAKLDALRESTIALRAIENELETLRARPYAALGNITDGPFISETPQLTALVNARPSVTIRDYGEGTLRLKEVTVRVVWTGEHGRRIEKSVVTLIGDKTS